jgi:SAM-dependent methyltransferase
MKGKIIALIPNWLKPYLRPIYRWYIRMATLQWRWHQKTRGEIHDYWKHPSDGNNSPQCYTEGEERSEFLVALMKQYVNSQSSILEVGCNVGRNLHYLFLAGFQHLSGIEISEDAVKLGRETYPETRDQVKIINATAEISRWLLQYCLYHGRS